MNTGTMSAPSNHEPLSMSRGGAPEGDKQYAKGESSKLDGRWCSVSTVVADTAHGCRVQ